MKNHRIQKTLLLLAATAVASDAASRPPATIQSYDSYHSWLVACDNGLSCVAKGFSDTDHGAEIRIERDAGPAGSLTASITAERKFALADIRIDGAPAGLGKPGWALTAGDDEGSSAVSDDPAAIRALVRRLRNATKVTLGEAGEVPLTGFAAAMLRLDERQGRLNGVTALLKPGALPASQVPPPPALPKIPNHPIQARLAAGEAERLIAAVRTSQKAVLDKEGCEETPEQPEAHALGGAEALVLIPCLMGAYQGSSLAFLASRTGAGARRLAAPTPYLSNDPDRSADQSETADFTDAVFDPKTGTLSMAAKGRGIADCGMSASWIWDGMAFHLSQMTLQQSCGGVGPGDWPTLFRSTH